MADDPAKLQQFNFFLIDKMLSYHGNYQLNFAGLVETKLILRNFLENHNKSSDLVCIGRYRIYRLYLLDFLENSLLLTYRLTDYLRSSNQSLVCESIQSLRLYLTLFAPDMDALLQICDFKLKPNILSKQQTLYLSRTLFSNSPLLLSFFLFF